MRFQSCPEHISWTSWYCSWSPVVLDGTSTTDSLRQWKRSPRTESTCQCSRLGEGHESTVRRGPTQAQNPCTVALRPRDCVYVWRIRSSSHDNTDTWRSYGAIEQSIASTIYVHNPKSRRTWTISSSSKRGTPCCMDRIESVSCLSVNKTLCSLCCVWILVGNCFRFFIHSFESILLRKFFRGWSVWWNGVYDGMECMWFMWLHSWNSEILAGLGALTG